MASGLNKVLLIGNLGRDPEVRSFDSSRKKVSFPLATSKTYTAKDGTPVTKTEWHNIVLWSPIAEVAERYLSKGRQVYIEGEITTRSWEDNTGNKRYITEIIGRTMNLLGGRSEEARPGEWGEDSKEAATPAPEPTAEENELPF